MTELNMFVKIYQTSIVTTKSKTAEFNKIFVCSYYYNIFYKNVFTSRHPIVLVTILWIST